MSRFAVNAGNNWIGLRAVLQACAEDILHCLRNTSCRQHLEATGQWNIKVHDSVLR